MKQIQDFFSLKKVILIYLLGNISQIDGAQPPSAKQLLLEHKKADKESLFMELGPKFQKLPVKQLIAPLEQDDNFSCAYRTLFHALCIKIALERVAQGFKRGKYVSTTHALRELLGNAGMLNQIHFKIKAYLDFCRPDYNQGNGIEQTQMPGILADLPKLFGTILPISLGKNNTITVLHDKKAPPNNPLLYTHRFIKMCGSSALPLHACSIPLDNSPELDHQLAKLSQPFAVAHFACQFPNHMFLASMVNENGIELLVIDSNNNPVDKHPDINTMVNKLLSYVQNLNNQTKARVP